MSDETKKAKPAKDEGKDTAANTMTITIGGQELQALAKEIGLQTAGVEVVALVGSTGGTGADGLPEHSYKLEWVKRPFTIGGA